MYIISNAETRIYARNFIFCQQKGSSKHMEMVVIISVPNKDIAAPICKSVSKRKGIDSSTWHISSPLRLSLVILVQEELNKDLKELFGIRIISLVATQYGEKENGTYNKVKHQRANTAGDPRGIDQEIIRIQWTKEDWLWYNDQVSYIGCRFTIDLPPYKTHFRIQRKWIKAC